MRALNNVCGEYRRMRHFGVCHGCGYAYDDNGNCRCNGGRLMIFAQAEVNAGAWKLPQNGVWNIPADQNEVRFDLETSGRGWNPLTKIEGLAITLDGRIFGKRRLLEFRESGYQQEGRVSIGGKKYRAFTSSKLFEREDGSLCDVAVLVVCNI